MKTVVIPNGVWAHQIRGPSMDTELCNVIDEGHGLMGKEVCKKGTQNVVAWISSACVDFQTINHQN
jgi:hypothetical protein